MSIADPKILANIVRISRKKTISTEDDSILKEHFSSERLLPRAYASWALSSFKDPSSKIYHVDCVFPEASDTNIGTEESPWKTIQKAAETAIAGDTVIVHSGVYRECVMPYHSGKLGFPITYVAAENARPIIKACDVWNSVWKKEANQIYSTEYTHLEWDPPNRFRPNIPENRCEQLFINEVFLKHVRTKDALILQENSFWISDPTNEIFVNFSLDPNTCTVERSVREQCFMPAVRGLEYVYLKGFTFIGGAAHVWAGGKWSHVDQLAVVSLNAGRHWLVENNIIEYGNAQGLQVAIGGCFVEATKVIPIVHAPENFELTYKTTDVSGHNTIRGNIVRNNGIAGIVGFGGMSNLIIEDNIVVGNGTKEYKGTCEESGIKFHVMVDSIIRRNTVSENNSYGIWLDGLCKRNRISQNILVNNANYPIFYELSEGPTLIDNNVIIDSRATPVAYGIYNQDGNLSITINNAVIGPLIGVKIRALFHRKYEAGMTTTLDNSVYNNVLSRCVNGCVSLMPEVDRCTNNHSNFNMLWATGGPVQCVLDNSSDVGVPWETLPLGKVLNYKGEGVYKVAIKNWKNDHKEDTESITIPDRVIFDNDNPEQILSYLVSIWTKRGLSLTDGYFPVAPISVHEWLQFNDSPLSRYTLKHTVWISSRAGFQLWESNNNFKKIAWDNFDVVAKEPFYINVPYVESNENITLAAGDSITLNRDAHWKQLVECPAEIATTVNSITIKATDVKFTGEFSLMLVSDTSWTYVPITVIDSYCIASVKSKCTAGGKYVVVAIKNNSAKDISGLVTVDIMSKPVKLPVKIPSNSIEILEFLTECSGLADALVTAILDDKRVTKRAILSFAEAFRSNTWLGTTRYELDQILPTNMAPMVRGQKRTSAGWRVRYDDSGIFFKIEVEHKFHKATSSDLEGIHGGDCVKLAIVGSPGARATVIGMSLRSDSFEQICGFNKTADDKKYPLGQSKILSSKVSKRGSRMLYDVAVPWGMLGLSGPISGRAFPLSILACKADLDINYELLWFSGIRYDECEGKESEMGLLWIV
jgi:parallel beta-helix repeat protein